MARGFDMFRFQAVPWPVLLDEVRYLESVGAGTIWIADHYGWPPEPETPILESWTTLGALAAATERIRLGTAVTDVALRHPAVLAKQVATLDCISAGRVELGVGAGFYERELAWIGIPFLTPVAAETAVSLIQPYAPHVAEELWGVLGRDTRLWEEPWPVADPALLERDT